MSERVSVLCCHCNRDCGRRSLASLCLSDCYFSPYLLFSVPFGSLADHVIPGQSNFQVRIRQDRLSLRPSSLVLQGPSPVDHQWNIAQPSQIQPLPTLDVSSMWVASIPALAFKVIAVDTKAREPKKKKDRKKERPLSCQKSPASVSGKEKSLCFSEAEV